MCGIVGFSGFTDMGLLRDMNARQAHRGPDDEGYYHCHSDGVSMAMRRLAIIDLAGGRQPMASKDKSIWIVFNGEILNAPELRRELVNDGYHFETDHSDTEVLIHLYAKYQDEMLSRLNGMFAFVIHDTRRRRLFGARDHLGIKPLYYCFDGVRLAFASELKSLKQVPWLTPSLNPQAVYDYLSFQCVPAPHSIVKNVAKLSAGEAFALNLETKALVVWRYWKPTKAEPGRRIQPRELQKLVRYELEAAVKRWMLSDVPVACSLSGGIDSSAILGLMAAHSSSPIKTYCLGFEDAPEIDEQLLAGQAAARWGADHHEIILRSSDLLDDLPAMVTSLDEPYAGGLPSWFVFKHMAGSVKVCMTGTGGDELFGNYGKWRPYENLAAGLRQATGHLRRDPRWLPELFRFFKGSRYSLYFRDYQKRHGLLSPDFAGVCRPSEDLIEKLWKMAEPCSARDAVRSIDMQIQLPDEFLHMTDRFSMAFSIEARPPFLDRKFAETMMGLSAFDRIGDNRLKEHLLAAVSDIVPPALLNAPKRGFVLPMEKWLRGPLREQLDYFFSPKYLSAQGIFATTGPNRFVRPFMEGRSENVSHVWTLFMFQVWWNQWNLGHS